MQLFLIWARLSSAFNDYTLNQHEGLQRNIHCRQLKRFGNVTLYTCMYVVLDKILSSLRDRCENNRAVYEMLSHPSNFSILVKTDKIVFDHIPTVTPFCERYHLEFIKCAEELLCFLRVYSQLFCIPPINASEYEDDVIKAEENENVEEIEKGRIESEEQ